MKKTILFFALLFFAVAGFAQVRPDQQTTKTPADTDAIYTQEDGSLKKVLFSVFKEYVIDGTLDSLILSEDSILIAFNGAGTEIFRDTIAVGSINTDNQTIDTLQLNGTILEISLEGDGEGLQTVNLASLQDGTGTDNQTIDTLQLNGTTLEISLEGDGQALQTVNLSSLQDGTGTDDQTAAEVPNTPAGNISATDVQAAINELDSEKASLTKLASNANGEGASLIGLEDATNIVTATTVEGGVIENRTAIDALEAKDTITTLADTAFQTPIEGQLSWALDVNQFWVYNGVWWEQLATENTTITNTIEATENPAFSLFRKKQLANEKINVVGFGDSKTLGVTGNMISSYLRTNFGNGGIGYSAPGTTPAAGLWFSYPTNYQLLNLSGHGLKSLSGHALQIDTVGNEYRIYSAKINGITEDSLTYFDAVDYWVLEQPNGGEIEILLDNVPYDTIDTNSGSTQKVKYTITTTWGSHDVKFRCLSYRGAGIVITDLNFKRSNNYGVVFHKIANGGSQVNNFNTLLGDAENTAVLSELDPDQLLVRFGTNEMSSNMLPATFKNEIIELTDTIKNYNDTLSIALCGLEFVNLTGKTYTQAEYSNEMLELAQDSSYGYINLLSLVPSWDDFDKLGYATDNVHENTEGGKVIGSFIYRHFTSDFDNFSASSTSSSGGGVSGSTNDLAYFDSPTTVTNISTADYDGETINFGGDNVNNLEIGNNNWMNINTVAGTSSITFWSEYDTNDSRFELTATSSYPARWQSTTTIPLEISKGSQGSIGDAVTFSRILELRGLDNALTLSGYATGSSITGTTDSYAVFDFQGKLVPRSLADLKSELDLTKTAYSIPFVDGSGAIQTNSISNSVVGGFGTYSGGNWWFNFSNNAGYLELNHFSKLASAGIHVSTAGFRASRWARDGSRSFIIESTPTTPSTGDTLTFTRDFEIWATTGKVIFNRYTSSSSITGTTNHFITQSSDGSILTRSDSEMRTDLQLAPLSGSGVPAVTPRYNGDKYFDYTNSIWYSAWDNENLDGTGDGLDADDWVALN